MKPLEHEKYSDSSQQGQRDYILDICGERKLHNPTKAEIHHAVLSLDTKKNSAFLVLGTSDMTYIQTSGDQLVGFDLEYQEGNLTQHYRAKCNFTVEEIVDRFVSYMSDAADWKISGDWERMADCAEASSKFQPTRQAAWAAFLFSILWGGLMSLVAFNTLRHQRVKLKNSKTIITPDTHPWIYWAAVVVPLLLGLTAIVLGTWFLLRHYRAQTKRYVKRD